MLSPLATLPFALLVSRLGLGAVLGPTSQALLSCSRARPQSGSAPALHRSRLGLGGRTRSNRVRRVYREVSQPPYRRGMVLLVVKVAFYAARSLSWALCRGS